VPMMFAGMSNAVPHHAAGRLRILAVGGTRNPALPDVPTVGEAGVPGFYYAAWTGYFVPAGTSRDIAARLHADITRVLALPDVRDRLNALGFELVGSTPEALAARLKTDTARMAEVVRAAGIPQE
jgi:tripartite-type tricarboxylate transporter receptor subunit TctC